MLPLDGTRFTHGSRDTCRLVAPAYRAAARSRAAALGERYGDHPRAGPAAYPHTTHTRHGGATIPPRRADAGSQPGTGYWRPSTRPGGRPSGASAITPHARAYVDDWMQARLGGCPARPLREALGVRVGQYRPLGHGELMRVSDGSRVTGRSEPPHTESAETLAACTDGMLDADPPMLRQRAGRYLSTRLEDADYDALVRQLLEEAGVTPELPGLPAGAEAVTRHAPDGRSRQTLIDHGMDAVHPPHPEGAQHRATARGRFVGRRVGEQNVGVTPRRHPSADQDTVQATVRGADPGARPRSGRGGGSRRRRHRSGCRIVDTARLGAGPTARRARPATPHGARRSPPRRRT
ncbi:beta-galactosidase trimerization domain-containing protein [Streptomyces sp. NPDC006259]|uniref:beta-galactosidase trimerization domain-containing protein n=1 Tax=Streptomyces sp. NPDC006259 TaxID=3364740 RepID=UPI0036C0B318